MKITRDKGIIENASAPTSADVYRVGTIWVDTTNDVSYTLTDVTAGVSTWLKTAGIGSGSIDLEGDYLLNDQTTTNMMSKGTVYRFDGVDDVITITDSAEIQNIFAGGGAIHAKFNANSDGETNGGVIVSKFANGYIVNVQSESGTEIGVRFLKDYGTSNGIWSVTGVKLQSENDIVIVYDTDTSATAPTMYINGTPFTPTLDLAPGGTLTSDAGSDFLIGARAGGSYAFDGEIGLVELLNFAPTAAEVKDLISGNIPFKWQYGSQTNLIPTADDKNFGANAVGQAAFDAAYTWATAGTPTTITVATNVLTLVADTAAEGILIPGMLTGGKEYTFRVNVSSITSGTWRLAWHDGSSYQTIQELTATDQTITFTPGSNANGTLYINATTASGEIAIDASAIDNELIALGAVALYTQDSISPTRWEDVSGNNNPGAVTGCEVLNPPSVSPLLAMHSIVALVEPGGTAGTNIDVTDNSSTDGTWNPVSTSNAVNMTNDGGAFGSWTLTVSGQVLTLALGNIVGFLSASIGTHDINSSSASDIYTISASVSGGNLLLRIKLVGSTSAVDWRTVMDAGDLAAVFVSYVTAT